MDIKRVLLENFPHGTTEYPAVVSHEGFGDLVAGWRRYKARGIGVNLSMGAFDKPVETLKKIQQELKKSLQQETDKNKSVQVSDKGLLAVFQVHGKFINDPLKAVKQDHSGCKMLLMDYATALKSHVGKLKDGVDQVVVNKRYADDVLDDLVDLSPPLEVLKPIVFKPDVFLYNEYIPDIDRQRSEQELVEAPEELSFKKHPRAESGNLTLDRSLVEALIKAVDDYIDLMLQARRSLVEINRAFVRIVETEKKAEQQEDEDSTVDRKFYILTQITDVNIFNGMITVERTLKHVMRVATAITKLCSRYTK